MATSKKKRFELRDAKHDKFWEIDVAGASVTVRFGRLGSAGVEKATKFAAPAEAERAAMKLVAQKTKKGYRAAPAGRALEPAKLPAGVRGQLARLSALWAEASGLREAAATRGKPGSTGSPEVDYAIIPHTGPASRAVRRSAAAEVRFALHVEGGTVCVRARHRLMVQSDAPGPRSRRRR
jgi:predicted DNA-binding WGR domain protein